MSSTSLAATKQDVINAINAHYQVGDTNFRLPQKYINMGEEYLNSHPLTSEQYSQILACINSAVAYAREIGHLRYKEYTKEQINKGLSFVLAACKAAEVNLKEEINKEKNNCDDDKNINTDITDMISKRLEERSSMFSSKQDSRIAVRRENSEHKT